MPKSFRAAAYPLITIDPYISIWSCADTLISDYTRHWTGRPAPIFVAVDIDGQTYKVCAVDKDHINRNFDVTRFAHKSVEVTPLTTTYVFTCNKAELTLRFTTPSLPERLDILSRPVSFVEYDIKRTDGKEGGVVFRFGISAEVCVNRNDQQVEFKRTGWSLCCGNVEQQPLHESGDSVLIDWGYLHLCDADAYVSQDRFREKADENKVYTAHIDQPYLMVDKQQEHGVITLAYDEITPIEYFGKPVNEYYLRNFGSLEEMVAASKAEYPEIRALCDAFDAQLLAEAEKVGENYARIVCLAYRQAIAAHKLIADEDGKIIFLSKECHSNGCIGTLDVTYPSIPLFLKYNPELVLGMLRPIIRYAQSDAWPYGFAPHDVGQYPLANGQVYGDNAEDLQMPVEESGNMLLCAAAAAKYSKNNAFFEENKGIFKTWADYLVKFGYDPGNQLCTDDFAGHLAHNCNLSVKAILGIAAYGAMSGEKEYMEIAAKYAKQWEQDAANAGGTRLVFDKEDGWSLKYNMVWDNLLGYHLFSEDVKRREAVLYMRKLNEYGVPLDSRSDYTKVDWLLWSTCLCDNAKYRNLVCAAVVKMMNETTDRVPLTDWYDTKTALHHHFQHRSVVGGLFINMLAE